MRKNLINCLAATLLVLVGFNVNAKIVPYKAPGAQDNSAAKYDLNADSYVTEGEIEEELREEAVEKAIKLQKKGVSQAEVNSVIEKMEVNVTKDAEAIVDKLDKDGDELIEPEELKAR